MNTYQPLLCTQRMIFLLTWRRKHTFPPALCKKPCQEVIFYRHASHICYSLTSDLCNALKPVFILLFCVLDKLLAMNSIKDALAAYCNLSKVSAALFLLRVEWLFSHRLCRAQQATGTYSEKVKWKSLGLRRTHPDPCFQLPKGSFHFLPAQWKTLKVSCCGAEGGEGWRVFHWCF